MGEKCCLCSSEEFELVKSELRDDKRHFKVYRCAACGHVQLLPKPSAESDREFYDQNLQDKNRDKVIDFTRLKDNNRFDTLRHLKILAERFADKNAKILDIGSGYGFFVNALCEAQYRNVLGIEISRERRDLARAHGSAQIIDYDLRRPDLDIGTFDVVTLFHVLEHASDPIGFLRDIRRLIGGTGVLICEVPNVGEMLLDHCREYNDFYWIRAHVNYFHHATLRRCLRSAGFNDIEIVFEQRYGLMNLCHWLATGKPQIEKPVFEIAEAYSSVESSYREWLKSIGRTDALIAMARVGGRDLHEDNAHAKTFR